MEERPRRKFSGEDMVFRKTRMMIVRASNLMRFMETPLLSPMLTTPLEAL